MKNKPLFLSIIIFLMIITGLLNQNSNIILSSLFLVFYLLFDLVFKPEKKHIKLIASRKCESFAKEDYYAIKVNLELSNMGSTVLYIILDQDFKDQSKIIQGITNHWSAIKPGQKTMQCYTFKTTRGVYEWNKLTLKVSGPFACFMSSVTIDAQFRIIIQPRFKKIRSFKWHPWKTLSSQGLFETARSGSSTDFFGVREYHPGDSLKTLYWKLTARHQHKFFSKEFVQERNASITLVVDARKNMDLTVDGKSIIEYGITLSASLSEMFLSQGNQLGLSIIGQKNGNLRSGYGKKQLHRILNCLAETGLDNNELYADLSSLNRKQFSGKTQFIFISPFHYNDITYYRNLRFLGYQITLICPDILYSVYSLKTEGNDKALRMCKIERKLYLDLLARMSITVINWKLDQPIQAILKNVFSKPMAIKKL